MRTASDLLRTPWLTSWSSKILTVLAGRLPACHSLCQPALSEEILTPRSHLVSIYQKLKVKINENRSRNKNAENSVNQISL